MPGRRLARGVCRHLGSLGFACIEEMVPAPGLRVDVMALGRRGEAFIPHSPGKSLIALA